MAIQISFETAKSRLLDALFDLSRSQPTPRVADRGSEISSAHISLQSPAAASQTEISHPLQKIIQSVDFLFQDDEFRSKFFSPLMKHVQSMPDHGGGLLKVLHQMKEKGLSLNTMGETLELFDGLSRSLEKQKEKWPSTARFVPERFWEKTTRHISALISQVLPQQISKAKPKQEAVQKREEAAQNLIRFLTFAQKERPASFESELVALRIIQGSQLGLSSYTLIADKVDPVRLALLIHAARRGGPGVPTQAEDQLIGEFLKAVTEDQDLAPIIAKWEKTLIDHLPEAAPHDRSVILHALDEGLLKIPLGEKHGIWLQAFSAEEGLLPDEAWKIEPNPYELSVRGSMVMTSPLPVGLHRLKARVRDKKGRESWMECLVFIFGIHDLVEEEDEKEMKGPPVLHPYDPVELKPETPVAGMIELDLEAPQILTRPRGSKGIGAPLQVSFRFLMDFVHPSHRFSREKFLTFSASSEAQGFRKAVTQLSQKGIAGYDSYAKSLNRLFERLETLAPSGFRSGFEKAKKYLRDEVLLYLMGKGQGEVTVSEKKSPLSLLSPQGDVMASICSTMAGTMACLSDEVGEALIQFTDAAQVAKNKPYFLQRLDEFFKNLRERLQGGVTSQPPPWMGDLPILPPSVFEAQKARAAPLALASAFMEKVVIIEADSEAE